MSKLAAVLALVIAAVLVPAPASASPWVHVWLESTTSGLCVAIPNASDGAVPTQETCVDVGTQLWTFDDIASGVYRIRSTGTGKCLAASGTTAVIQLTCANTTAQRWTLSGSGNSYKIRSVSATTKCLARPGSAVGASLNLGTCSLLSAQWLLLF